MQAIQKHVIVLLSGPQGSGKSTIQKTLVARGESKGYLTFMMNFADIIYKIHDFALTIMEVSGARPHGKKDGELLQYLGTEWGRRKYGEQIWAEILVKRVAKIFKDASSPTMVIVGDCRFENEFDIFPQALRVRLNAPEEVRKLRTTAWRENTKHASEVNLNHYEAMGKFDLYLDTGIDGVGPEGCVDLIFAKIQKGDWESKRKQREVEL